MNYRLLLILKLLLVCNCLFCPALLGRVGQPKNNRPIVVNLGKSIPVFEFRSAGVNDYYVILFTGNGGLRNLVKILTNYLNSKNVSVLVIDTQKYLWSEKSPSQIASDLELLIAHYNLKWGLDKEVLIGYSMGAELLPFAVNCMKEKYSGRLKDIILIGPGQKATFKIKLLDYVYVINSGADVYPEIVKMENKPAYIICDNLHISICHKESRISVDHDLLKGGHHFGRNYATLSMLVGKRLKLE